jgi:hypothetical protein
MTTTGNDMTTEQARRAYLTIRTTFCAATGMTRAEFDQVVIEAAAPASPVQWVAGATEAVVKCERCSGTGRFGKEGSKSKGGDCYRCGGKGVQNLDDARRNYAYDRYAIAEAV